jgi:hypothetical protein
LAGCSLANIALTGEEWEKKEIHEVKGRQGLLVNQKLSFGEYYTTTVSRSWTKDSSSSTGLGLGMPGIPGTPDYTNLISLEYIQKKQTLQFELTDKKGNKAAVFAATRFRAKDLYLGDEKNGIFNIGIGLLALGSEQSSNLYYVQIYPDADATPWQLVLDNDVAQREAREYRGYLYRSAAEYYQIVPVTKMMNKKGEALQMPLGSMGFEIRSREGVPLAAVSLADRGKVYFTVDLSGPEKFLLANACAALLLQEIIG